MSQRMGTLTAVQLGDCLLNAISEPEGATATEFHRKAVSLYWDSDENDVREAFKTLLTRQLVYITFDRKIRLTVKGISYKNCVKTS